MHSVREQSTKYNLITHPSAFKKNHACMHVYISINTQLNIWWFLIHRSANPRKNMLQPHLGNRALSVLKIESIFSLFAIFIALPWKRKALVSSWKPCTCVTPENPSAGTELLENADPNRRIHSERSDFNTITRSSIKQRRFHISEYSIQASHTHTFRPMHSQHFPRRLQLLHV